MVLRRDCRPNVVWHAGLPPNRPFWDKRVASYKMNYIYLQFIFICKNEFKTIFCLFFTWCGKAERTFPKDRSMTVEVRLVCSRVSGVRLLTPVTNDQKYLNTMEK